MSDIQSNFNRSSASIFSAGQKADVIVLGDSDHRKLSLTSLLSSEDFLNEAKENNVKQIAVELPVGLQALLDDFFDGKISEQALHFVLDKSINSGHIYGDARNALVENFTNLCVRGKENGIRVLAADGFEGFIDSETGGPAASLMIKPETQKIFTDIAYAYDIANAAAYNQNGSEADRKRVFDESFLERFGTKPDEVASSVQDKFYGAFSRPPVFGDTMLDMRVEQDPIVAARIAQRHMKNGGKTVVFYGAGHTMHGENDIDSSLRKGGLNVLVVDLFTEGIDCAVLVSPETHSGCVTYALRTYEDTADQNRHYLDMRDGQVHKYPEKTNKGLTP